MAEFNKNKPENNSKKRINDSLIYLDRELKNSISNLSKYQKWRLGESDETIEPKELTESLNTVLKFLKNDR